MNLQNLFLSKTVKRNSQNDSRSLIKSRSFFTAKPTQSQSKYKGLSFVVNNNASEKKPVFRITSVSQNLYSAKQDTEETDTGTLLF